jgi:hypothetical protein
MFLRRPPGPKSILAARTAPHLGSQKQDQSARRSRGAKQAKDGEKERKAKKRKGKRFNL